jgi:UDP-N-acetylglucosamine--N-acetylmuramyl-(pentapeptide) pyrophosphoryl-undecaprenol N-acetylglucosamine transferase
MTALSAAGATRTIMIMAGGTGGHIFPALSVAEELRGRGWRIVWLGSRAGMEATLVPPLGYSMAWTTMSGVRGKGPLRALMLPLQVLIAFAQSARAIFAHRPDIVLGMGGYVSFPGGMMASLFNRPLAIHEQNSVAGLANRVLSRLADRVFEGFPGALGAGTAAIWTGNPVRREIALLAAPEQRYPARSGKLRLTVIGGSRGAHALNTIVPQALALVADPQRPQVTHQAGAGHLEEVEANYRRAGVHASLTPFIADIAAQYGQSDLIICRAGASTIAELAAAGIASVLVPFPYAVDDHQTHNARFLSDRGAAILIPQSELTPEKLAGLLRGFTRESLLDMARKARAVAKPEASRTVAEACMALAA